MRDIAEDKAHASKCSVPKAPSILGSGCLGFDVASPPVSSLMAATNITPVDCRRRQPGIFLLIPRLSLIAPAALETVYVWVYFQQHTLVMLHLAIGVPVLDRRSCASFDVDIGPKKLAKRNAMYRE